MASARQYIWGTSHSDSNIAACESAIANAIAGLRNAESATTLADDTPASPIPKDEAEVQALRYLRGFIIITRHTTGEVRRAALLKKLNHSLKSYQLQNQHGHQAKLTYWLADQFAKIIAEVFNVTDDASRKQITMARDLGILLDKHSPVKTTTSTGDLQVTQMTELYKIRPNQRILRYQVEPWFAAAKKMAGFEVNQPTWLDLFFQQKALQIAANGVPSLPSARWLPTAANIQEAHTIVTTADGQHDSHTSMFRMGTVVALDFKNTAEQQKIAYNILYEIIRDNLRNCIYLYRKLYNLTPNERIVFFVNYQTLLSPLPLERALPHKDNNAYFVSTSKEILNRIRALTEWEREFPNTTLITTHTNAAINKHASHVWPDSNDTKMRRIKISQTKKIFVDRITTDSAERRALNKLTPLQLFAKINTDNTSVELVNELRLRAHACEQLTNLLDKKPPFNALSYSQYNLMMAALEFLTMGRQCLAIAGCKSGRDRTTFLLAAVKTMQENMDAMHDWSILEAGIIKSLEEGHFFRSMNHHTAVVKVGAVLEEFLHKLSPQTQKDISGLKKFSKSLKAFEHEFPEHTHYSFWSLFKPAAKLATPIAEEKPNEHNHLRASGDH